VLSGYYGFNNLGDEAILSALVQQIHAIEPDAKLVALSGNPEHTRGRLGIEAVHRMDPAAVYSAIKGADLFVSGGGSLLQDVTGPGSVPYYLGLVWLAQRLGKPTMFLGQGVGPLNALASRWMVGQVAKKADALTVRDQASSALLVRCGAPADRVQVTADPVLAMDPVSGEVAAALRLRVGLEAGRPTIAVAIRPWATWYERQLKSFSAVLAQRAAEWGAQILLLPFHRPDDEALIDELHHCLITRPPSHAPKVVTLVETLAPEEMMGLLAGADLLVGMRLHALIMGAACAVPAIALVYDPKVSAFADLAGYPTIASVTDLEDSTDVGALMGRVWNERLALGAGLRTRRDEWRLLARKNVEVAVELARRSHDRSA
jgi:polysaccharide pyruvyl transferase CsaB